MRSVLATVLVLASCFNPPQGRPSVESSSESSGTPPVPTTSVAASTSTSTSSSSGGTTAAESTSFVTEPTTIVDTGPGMCGDVGKINGPCTPAWTCEDGAKCWPTPAGNVCAPDCNLMPMFQECTPCPADVGEFEFVCEPQQIVCHTPCVNSTECGEGMFCDPEAWICVWPSDCGPSINDGSLWQPCETQLNCQQGLTCIGDGQFSYGVCAPPCDAENPCPPSIAICGTFIDGPDIICQGGESGFCAMPCFLPSECPIGMSCSSGFCGWNKPGN